MRPLFEPMNMAIHADMTRKFAFILTLASAKETVKCGPSALMYASGKTIMQLPCRSGKCFFG